MPLPERKLISRIRQLAIGASRKATRGRLIAGIGEDCAVLRVPAGHEVLVTTDVSLEGVHFRREWHSPQDIGHRCLTRGLSDIAAMGGEPIAAFLSLALPARTSQRWVDGFLEGLLRSGEEFGVPLAGGDTTQSPDRILADIVVLGSAPKGKTILRSGARVGDRIYVTGALGAAAAETELLYSRGRRSNRARDASALPQPRIQVGRVLRQRGLATAMIDISDGLSTDLAHICEESSVGAEVWADAIPRAKFREKTVDLRLSLHGGDAYELLFTAPRQVQIPRSIAGIRISAIGEITRGTGKLILVDNQERTELAARGWEHFRSKRK
jgi:thiamine-monophosphate kinase